MSTTNPSAVVDTVLADLKAHSGLTPKETRSYAEPTVVPPDSCPILAVWCEDTAFELLTGASGQIAYERRHTLMAAWYVTDPGEAETGGTADPQTVHDLDAIAETLIAQIATYSSGLPGTSSQLVATIRSRQVRPLEGITWRALIEFTVEEAS